jgi:hypothetical protein
MTNESTPSKTGLYTGYVLSVLALLFLVMDAGMKFTHNPQVIEAQRQLEFPMQITPAIGVLALVCIALYAIPITSVLGALLLTGYFGGAIALHLRVDNPLFSHILFPVYIALFVWGGLWFRDRKLREVLPIVHPFQQPAPSKGRLWAGYIFTALGALLILLTAVMKFTYHPAPGGPPPIFPLHHIHHLGYIEIACTVLYLFPATSFLGASLATAYLGGAIATNLRGGGPVGPSLIPGVLGILLWAGLWLRNARVRELLPLRRRAD